MLEASLILLLIGILLTFVGLRLKINELQQELDVAKGRLRTEREAGKPRG